MQVRRFSQFGEIINSLREYILLDDDGYGDGPAGDF